MGNAAVIPSVVAKSGRKVGSGMSAADRVRLTGDKRQKEIVDEATTLIRTRIKHFRLSIAEISQLLLISPRELQRAFQAVHGCRPLQFIRDQRLDRIRTRLLQGHESDNVTTIATQFGTTELGRFSAEYRARFGELPSATLARAKTHRAKQSFPASFAQSESD
jgi:AraC-like DNA-binding protein